MKEITFLNENSSKQLEATLVAREMCEPMSPLYNSYTPSLMRLTTPIVVQCVEYAMAMNPDRDRKRLFAESRQIQTKFVDNTPVMNTKAVGQEFGIKLANQIFQRIMPDANPLNVRTAAVDTNNPDEFGTEAGSKLEELFKNLVSTQTQIADILIAHLNYVKTA